MPAPALEQRLLTVTEYEAMARAGILDEDDRVELLDGKIIAMSPIGGPHIACVNRLNALFNRHIIHRELDLIVSVQNPVYLDRYWAPEPDLALLRPADEPDQVPTADRVLLLVEVADTTLEKDRAVKVPQYAAAGIPEVWIVAMSEGYVEVYHRPMPDGYGTSKRYLRGESFESPTQPGLASIEVDAILNA